jgi:exopolyphosphatase/guanosine-5'-triphosphate,3'-diphosphate pyrophosphatase
VVASGETFHSHAQVRQRTSNLLAAIDIGSNSFRLEVGEVDGGQILRRLYLKEPVRLGAGLDGEGRLSQDSIRRGAACLARFREHLRSLDPACVRAVATNAVRVAANPEAFLVAGAQALGHPIEVISGREEARLIYQGVAHTLRGRDEQRLVVDIGGGSTEIIVGRGFQPLIAESYKLGSVSHSLRHFPEGVITADRLAAAEIASEADLVEAVHAFPRDSWRVAYGSSGTAGALSDVARGLALSDGTLSRPVLKVIREHLLRAGTFDQLDLPLLKPDRRAVIVGGYAVLAGVFQALGLDTLRPTKGALRHGVLYDLLGRRDHVDSREASVAQWARQFGVDLALSAAVEQLAQGLFGTLRPGAPPEAVRALRHAARLHEVGKCISHGDYHKHGAYMLEQGDLPGFSRLEQRHVAQLVLAQRGNLTKVADLLQGAVARDQVFALRLAVLLAQGAEPAPRQISARVRGGGYDVSTEADWPVRRAELWLRLISEQEHWHRVGYKWRVRAGPVKSARRS